MKKAILLFLFLTNNVLTSVASNLTFSINIDYACGFTLPNIFITISGGIGPYSYILDSTVFVGPNYFGISTGQHTLVVVDEFDQSSDTTIFSIFEYNGINATFSTINATCSSQCNGKLIGDISGGSPPFSINWDGPSDTSLYSIFYFPNLSNHFEISNLCPDQIFNNFYITDSNGCFFEFTNTTLLLSIGIDSSSVQSGLNIQLDSLENSHCLGLPGYASVAVSGGIPPYSYNWNTSTQLFQDHFEGHPGDYTIMVTDQNNNCGMMDFSIIEEGLNLSIDSLLSIGCNGNQGYVSVSVSNGTPPYTYFWNGTPSTSSSYSVSNPGNINCFVQDANLGCGGMNFDIGYFSLNVSTDSTANVSCNGLPGYASVSVSNGTPPYSYTWNDSNQSTTRELHTTTPGHFIVTVIDQSGNCGSQMVTIGGFSLNIVVDSIENVGCNGQEGYASVSVLNGTPPFSFSWNDANQTTGPELSINSQGVYTVRVDDANGQCGELETTIYSSEYINLFMDVNNIMCDNLGRASVFVSGYPQNYTYLWSNGETTAVNYPVNAGTYSVVVTEENGCEHSATIVVDSACLNVIEGHLFKDFNENCIQDLNEPNFRNIILRAGNYFANSDYNGNYKLFTPNMSDTIYVFNQTSCPTNGSLFVSFQNLGDTSYNNDFGLVIDTTQFDLGIWGNHYFTNPPGYATTFKISYFNNGYVSHDGTITLQYDSNLVYLSDNHFGINNPTNHSITWQINNIPGSYLSQPGSIIINFSAPNGLFINQELCSSLSILPTIDDANQLNNQSNLCQIIHGPFDPNYKESYPSGYISPQDSILNYSIHFQNTGNDTAFTVILKDTLSSSLDILSFEPGFSSHPYSYTISGTGIIKFVFENILLPDSGANQLGSQGFVNYSIKLKPNLQLGSEIKNTAYIYFDFNEPIITNTTQIVISENYIFEGNKNNQNILIWPNPSNGKFQLNLNQELNMNKINISITDIFGKELLNFILNEKNTNMDIDLSNGIYFIKSNLGIINKLIIQK